MFTDQRTCVNEVCKFPRKISNTFVTTQRRILHTNIIWISNCLQWIDTPRAEQFPWWHRVNHSLGDYATFQKWIICSILSPNVLFEDFRIFRFPKFQQLSIMASINNWPLFCICRYEYLFFFFFFLNKKQGKKKNKMFKQYRMEKKWKHNSCNCSPSNQRHLGYDSTTILCE